MSMINNSKSTVVVVVALAGSNVVVMGPGTHITEIWEDKVHIEKCEKNGRKGCRCLWCTKCFVMENAI